MLAGAIPVPGASADEPATTEPQCPDFRFVEFQGPSCPLADGLWEVFLGDGTSVFTHGPDPAPVGEGPEEIVVDATPSDPACAASTDYAGLLIYARPFDTTNNYTTMVATIRSMAKSANGVLREEAAEFGYVADYKMRCLAGGATLQVDDRVVNVSKSAHNFSNIVTDLKSQGYTSTLTKYWVWYDGKIPGIGGQGTIYDDQRSIIDNYNNAGPLTSASFGITYQYTDYTIMMHENGHNLGAVQQGAPDSSGGWHCNDGLDIMCYADGGNNSTYSGTVCTDRKHFDCHHDSYFRVGSGAGMGGNNYTRTSWNIGNISTARFIQYASATAPSMTFLTCTMNPTLVSKSTSCSFSATSSMPGVYYVVTWGDGSPTTRVPSSGTTAPGTTQFASHAWGSVGNYTVAVTATDSGTPPLTSGAITLLEGVRLPCISTTASLLVGLMGAPPVEGVNARTVAVPSLCGGKNFTLTTTILNDFDVCFLNSVGGTISCKTTRSTSESGVIPSGTASARIVYWSGVAGSYNFREL